MKTFNLLKGQSFCPFFVLLFSILCASCSYLPPGGDTHGTREGLGIVQYKYAFSDEKIVSWSQFDGRVEINNTASFERIEAVNHEDFRFSISWPQESSQCMGDLAYAFRDYADLFQLMQSRLQQPVYIEVVLVPQEAEIFEYHVSEYWPKTKLKYYLPVIAGCDYKETYLRFVEYGSYVFHEYIHLIQFRKNVVDKKEYQARMLEKCFYLTTGRNSQYSNMSFSVDIYKPVWTGHYKKSPDLLIQHLTDSLNVNDASSIENVKTWVELFFLNGSNSFQIPIDEDSPVQEFCDLQFQQFITQSE